MSETIQPQFEQETRAFEQMRFRLGERGMELLDSQLHTWAELNSRQLESPLRNSLSQGDTRLPEGTLFHGMGMHEFSVDALRSVSEIGIVSGELISAIEDSESHGCADFFRTPSATTLAEYFAWAKQLVRRSERLLMRGVSFIVDPQAEGMDKLLEHDGYRDREMAHFVGPLHGRTAEDTAAILGGVPRGAIAGVFVSARRFENPEIRDALISYFPDVPMFGHDGVALRYPAPE